jgi:hypothetical protein
MILRNQGSIPSESRHLVLLSKDYLSSQWSNYERALALKTARDRIVPVLIDDVSADQLPPMWRTSALIDATAGSEGALKEIEKKNTRRQPLGGDRSRPAARGKGRQFRFPSCANGSRKDDLHATSGVPA